MIPVVSLYRGSVMHRRFRPKHHFLKYRVFWMLLDIDAIDETVRGLRLFSRNRFNAVSFYDRDYGDGSERSLRAQVQHRLRKAGLGGDNLRIMLFCMPRIFGYGFNPLSVYFVYRADDGLNAILYEVHNTFGERHTYAFDVRNAASSPMTHGCDKDFYVSPFLDMAMSYTFRVAPPGESIGVSIDTTDSEGRMLAASLSGKRVSLHDGALLRALAAFPLMTLKVIGAIHWHALRMWLKGFKLVPRPPAEPRPVTKPHGSLS